MNSAVEYVFRRMHGPHDDTVLDVIPLNASSLIIGRDSQTADIVVRSLFYTKMISRKHVQIRRTVSVSGMTSFHLIDTSLNGTYVNGFRAPIDPLLLSLGDVVGFGHVNGAAIVPGQRVDQPYNYHEFCYVMDKRSAPTSLSDVGLPWFVDDMSDLPKYNNIGNHTTFRLTYPICNLSDDEI